MGKITTEHIKKAFTIGREVHLRNLTLTEGSEILFGIGMNESSAKGYINSYSYLIQGKLLTRTISAEATAYFLEQIFNDNGTEGLRKALSSLSQHFDYYEQTSGSTMSTHRRIYKKYYELLSSSEEVIYPEEFDEELKFTEGKMKMVQVNSYERNKAARQKCIDYFGYNCQICDYNFEENFGALGREFIHVHHIVDISTIGQEYLINPITDLVPVCPNCHSMLHTKRPAYSVKDLKEIVKKMARKDIKS